MPEISDVSPGRGRASDTGIVIDGAAFASSPFTNTVQFQGNTASKSAEDEFQITANVPGCSAGFGLCITDQWIALTVQRQDTGEWAAVRWWIKADLADLQTDSKLTEKIPTGEDLDNPTNEFLTATLWNRLVTFAEWLTQEVLSAKGSVIGRSEAGIVEVLVGNDEEELHRVPAGSGREAGLLWGPPLRIWTYRWGRLIDTGNTRNGAMEANGDGTSTRTGVLAGTHGMARDGIVRHLTVNVESAVGGDTLDQVTVVWNGSTTIYDSGTGLGIAANASHRATINDWRGARDLEVRAFKSGTVGTMALTATLTIQEEVRPQTSGGVEEVLSDAVSVSDSLTSDLVLGGYAEDTADVTDAMTLEMSYDVQLSDAIDVNDVISVAMDLHMMLSDSVYAPDSIAGERDPTYATREREISDSMAVSDSIEAGLDLGDPNDMLGDKLALWLDGTDASTITEDANGISNWANKSTGASAAPSSVAQTNNTRKPNTQSSAINGLDAVRFLSSPGEFLFEEGNPAVTAPPFHVFVVLRHHGGANNAAVFQSSDASAASLSDGWALAAKCGFGNVEMRMEGGGTLTVTTAGSLYSCGDSIIAEFIEAAADDHRLYLDGDNETTSGISRPVTSANVDQTVVGVEATNNRTNFTNFANADIGELIVANDSLTTGERSNILTYLSDRWGISVP